MLLPWDSFVFVHMSRQAMTLANLPLQTYLFSLLVSPANAL